MSSSQTDFSWTSFGSSEYESELATKADSDFKYLPKPSDKVSLL